MENDWQFAGSFREKEPFELQRVSVWEQGWQIVPGQEAQVQDPVCGQGYLFRVYDIQDDHDRIKFAARQFSSGASSIAVSLATANA